MKFSRFGFLFSSLLFVQSIIAQEKGVILLSNETLNKFAYSYELDQYRLEHYELQRFSNFGWKYHAGDDMGWKEPAFNDSSWFFLRTDFPFDSMAENEWQGIGWFRLRLLIDSSLYNQAIALVMTHYGASEIYLDGKLINQFGVPSEDPAVEKTLRPLFAQPVIVSLDDKPDHILAIRYSFLKAKSLFKRFGILGNALEQFGSAGFLLHFGKAKQAIDFYGDSLTKNLFSALVTLVALLLIGSFHFILYLFYAHDRSNLYISLFNFVLAGHAFTKFLPTYAHLGFQSITFDSLFNILFGSIWFPISMVAYYSVFYMKLPRYVWFYFLLTPFFAYLWIFDHQFGDRIAMWPSLIIFFDMTRLFVRSVIRRERYIWIIGIGVLLSQSTVIIYFIPSMSQINRYYLVFPVFLAVPIAMSIVNALRTARTSISLENQLTEVKRLSEFSLAQQEEKQQILNSQKELLALQVEERTSQLRHSLENLKSTQAQLVQSEKMASLGELTAGIAHEIQNPLNFVNNFSELNNELLEEMKGQMDEGNTDTAKSIANDVIGNGQKILTHGKRADAIVKGMLQHSRTSTGQKELTDINAMAEEYLRLAYHGLRAKDKSFNASFRTEPDESIGKINIIPQDMGSVLVNLINNSFYAVAEKNKQNIVGYAPTVTIKTKKLPGKIELRVIDNGSGIPAKLLDKIFQPFFTTKPTGQGTGLGLSLSYDIITKGHGGEMKVETKEGEGSEFVIWLPIQ